jgi:predicted secreted protein
MEEVRKNIGDEFEIELHTRGGAGLTMLYRINQEDIVAVERLQLPKTGMLKPGDPTKAVYRLRAQKKGNVRILFYETRTWDKDFNEIPVKELAIVVE